MIIHDSWIRCHDHGMSLVMASHESWMNQESLSMDGQSTWNDHGMVIMVVISRDWLSCRHHGRVFCHD